MTLEELRSCVESRIWKRGADYAEYGHVIALSREGSRVIALVEGSEPHPYDVWLDFAMPAQNEDAWSCNCPMGVDSLLCKHVVAAAIVAETEGEVLPEDEDDAFHVPADRPPKDALEAFLAQQPADVLAERLNALAAEFDEVDRALRFWMRTAQADNNSDLRNAISGMIGRPRFLDWQASNDYARRLDAIVDMLQGMLSGQPERVADAAAYALKRLFKIYERADDSGGGVGDALRDVGRLHAEATRRSSIDSPKLARELLKLQQADHWGILPLDAYREALGEQGLRIYGDALEKRWAALPPPEPPRRSHSFYSGEDSQRLHLRLLLEDWCRVTGDIDRLIAIKAEDLTRPYAYLNLVKCCIEHGRDKPALDWAERGHKAFPDDPRLCEALAERYRQEGFGEDALSMRWRSFELQPHEAAFGELREAAGDDWPQWRERALDFVQHKERTGANGVRDVSSRIALLLAEDAVGEALEVLQGNGCRNNILERLAHAAADSHPQQAAQLYRSLVEQMLPQRTGKYGDIVEMLQRFSALAPPESASAYLGELRTRFRAKRNFIRDLDACGL